MGDVRMEVNGSDSTVDLGKGRNKKDTVRSSNLSLKAREAMLHERVHRVPNKDHPSALKKYVEDLREYANIQLACFNDDRLLEHERREITLERPVSDESMGGAGAVYLAKVNPELKFEVRGRKVKVSKVAVKIGYPSAYNDYGRLLPAYIDQSRRQGSREGQTARTLWNHLRKKSAYPFQPRQVSGIGYLWELVKSGLYHIRGAYLRKTPHFEEHLVYCFKAGEIGRGHGKEVRYQIQEYVEGLNLWQYIERHGNIGLTKQLAEIAKDVAAVLEGCLELDVVHRDVSPGNVIISNEGVNKVCDLGLIKGVDDYLGESRYKEVVGTPGFIAPEHLDRDAPISPRSDMWSLGAVLYFAATGKRHCRTSDDETSARYDSISNGHRGAVRELAQSIEACLEKDPRNRPHPTEMRMLSERLYGGLEYASISAE